MSIIILKPDTCKCVIHQDFDTNGVFLGCVSTPLSSSTPLICQFHQSLGSDIPTVHQSVLDENRLKNNFEGVFNQLAGANYTLTSTERDLFKKFAVAAGAADSLETAETLTPTAIRAFAYKWGFDAQRKLEVDVSKLPTKDQADAQAEIDSKFQGKVILK